jgi:zinc/manganese transport system substrate-binding protein
LGREVRLGSSMGKSRSLLLAGACAGAALLLGSCGASSRSPFAHSAGKLRVLAAENTWGSIAAPLGGNRVAVVSVISNPSTDPHSYEPTAADGVAVARSQMAIVNGMGYDTWASKLLAASSSGSRLTLDVGRVLGSSGGANPHQWYSPASVRRVIGAISADYARLDPRSAGYFAKRRADYEERALAPYDSLRSEIRARYAGVPVGYSESVFEPLGADLRLRLMTPRGFATAIAEGTDVSAADKKTVDEQARRRAIKAWVYNSQNTTPDVQRVNELARAAHIPIVTITETLSPASASFEQWQVQQLRSLLAALEREVRR